MRRLLSAILLLAGLAYPSAGQTEAENSAVLPLQNQLIQILIDKDTTKFLSLIGSAGVSFGVDGETQFKDQIQTQFDRKEGVYCFLFDTRCLGRETGRKRQVPPCSLHDMVKGKSAWSMDHQAAQQGGGSQIYLILKPNNELCPNGKDSVGFVFAQVGDGWNLVAVPYE